MPDSRRDAKRIRSTQLQYLFPIRSLQLYGPSAPADGVLDPQQQDNKTDFQKQNVASFLVADTQLIRGIASAGGWSGPFLRLSYRAGPDSVLAGMARASLGPTIRLLLKVGRNATPAPLSVPYDAETGRYAIELWGWPGTPGRSACGARPARPGGIRSRRTDCRAVAGAGNCQCDFLREALDDRFVNDVAPDHAMHPTRPLHIEAAWATADESVWDSLGGANYQFEFSMVLRGWDNYLGVGTSPNPHGGLGFLEYRNLLSNYGRYAGMGELGRNIPPWSFDAFGRKAPASGARSSWRSTTWTCTSCGPTRPSACIGIATTRRPS